MAERARDVDIKDQPGFRSIAIICFVVLYVPILILMIFSFNTRFDSSRIGRASASAGTAARPQRGLPQRRQEHADHLGHRDDRFDHRRHHGGDRHDPREAVARPRPPPSWSSTCR